MANDDVTAGLNLENITIRFGDVVAVSEVNLDIAPGEFFTLLGPSGCGKTTLLRAIAGFNRQSAGTISLGDEVIDNIPAHKRDTGMVFQSYAVFPHLSVWENVRYGLKPRGVTGKAAEERIRTALEMVDLLEYADRMPKQLSGGQQQRVVIARAVAVQPRILLMDEPLANLDAKLRVRLRNDLKQLQKSLGITTIYVTHDQEEALSLSDRIAVMSMGHVMQVDKPEVIYDQPATLSVAEFIGEGSFIRGELLASAAGEKPRVKLSDSVEIAVRETDTEPGNVWIGVRPQDVTISEPENGMLVGTVEDATYIGSYVRYSINCGFESPIAVEISAHDVQFDTTTGRKVGLNVPAERVMVFPGEERKEEL